SESVLSRSCSADVGAITTSRAASTLLIWEINSAVNPSASMSELGWPAGELKERTRRRTGKETFGGNMMSRSWLPYFAVSNPTAKTEAAPAIRRFLENLRGAVADSSVAGGDCAGWAFAGSFWPGGEAPASWDTSTEL